MCLVYTTFLHQFFLYLVQADADYLDLQSPGDPSNPGADPSEAEMRCGRPDGCPDDAGVLPCLHEQLSRGFKAVDLSEALPQACELPASTPTKCVEVSVPLVSFHTELIYLYTVDRKFNPFNAWALLYFVLMFAMITTMLFHDLVLLLPECRPWIYTRHAFRSQMPSLHSCIKKMQLVPAMDFLREKCNILWAVLLPLWLAWSFGIFTFVLYPWMLVNFLYRPVSLSRIMVFYTALLCFCWSLLFIIYTAAQISDYFTIFWSQSGVDAHCVCHCQYPLRGGIIQRVVLLASLACVASFGTAFRALRGLRQASWATLFSVTYVVPIEVFPTRWERPGNAESLEVTAPEGVSSLGLKVKGGASSSKEGPCVVSQLEEGGWAERAGILEGDELVGLNERGADTCALQLLQPQGRRPLQLRLARRSGGGPIRFRTDGEPVQGEPAFDPFCLMDEQPESALQSVRLVPCDMSFEQRQRWYPEMSDQEEVQAEIGCCGFPLRHTVSVRSPASAWPEAEEGADGGGLARAQCGQVQQGTPLELDQDQLDPVGDDPAGVVVEVSAGPPNSALQPVEASGKPPSPPPMPLCPSPSSLGNKQILGL
jgi:hypothetical protein